MHRRNRTRRFLPVMLALLVACSTATACTDSGSARGRGGSGESVTLDPAVTVPEPDPGGPAGPEVWVVDADTDQLVALDPALSGVVRMVDVGAAVLDHAVTPDAVWVAAAGTAPFLRVPRPAGRPAPVPLGSGVLPRRVAAADGAVWIAGAEANGPILRFDTVAGAVTGGTTVGDRVDHLAVGAGGIWAAAGRVLFRLDPGAPAVTGSVELPLEAGEDLAGLAVEGGSVWALAGGALWQVDPASLAVADPVEVASDNSHLAAGDSAVWVADTFRNDIHRIDPATGAVAATLRPVTKPVDLAAGGGALYVVHAGGLKLARIDPADGRFLSGVMSKVSLRDVTYG